MKRGWRADDDVVVGRPNTSEVWVGANWLPWDLDVVARHLTAKHGPFTLEEVATFMGLSRERVRQIEADALRAFHRGMTALGYSDAEMIEMLRRENRDHVEPATPGDGSP